MLLFYSAVETRQLYCLKTFYQTIDLEQFISQVSHKGQLAAIYHYYVAIQYLLGELVTISDLQLQDLPAFDALSVAHTKALLTQEPQACARYSEQLANVNQTSYSFLQVEKKFYEQYLNT